jgi:hypothetical protein
MFDGSPTTGNEPIRKNVRIVFEKAGVSASLVNKLIDI